jgi:hypothetical protein
MIAVGIEMVPCPSYGSCHWEAHCQSERREQVSPFTLLFLFVNPVSEKFSWMLTEATEHLGPGMALEGMALVFLCLSGRLGCEGRFALPPVEPFGHVPWSR